MGSPTSSSAGSSAGSLMARKLVMYSLVMGSHKGLRSHKGLHSQWESSQRMRNQRLRHRLSPPPASRLLCLTIRSPRLR